MLRIGEHTYPLLAVDTNVLSAVALDHPGVRRGFFRLFADHAICVSPYSLFEIRRSPAAHTAYLRTFDTSPCVLLKDDAMLFEAERRLHPNRGEVNPVLPECSDAAEARVANLECILEREFESLVSRERAVGWPAVVHELLADWLALKPSFRPRGTRYGATDGLQFVNETAIRYVRSHAPQWNEAQVRTGVAISARAFPSVRMTLWSVFFRMYWAESPKGYVFDALDALISGPTPYVEAVATENFQADIYRKVQKLEPSLLHLSVHTLGDISAAGHA